jgi:hypothetical protein
MFPKAGELNYATIIITSGIAIAGDELGPLFVQLSPLRKHLPMLLPKPIYPKGALAKTLLKPRDMGEKIGQTAAANSGVAEHNVLGHAGAHQPLLLRSRLGKECVEIVFENASQFRFRHRKTPNGCLRRQ